MQQCWQWSHKLTTARAHIGNRFYYHGKPADNAKSSHLFSEKGERQGERKRETEKTAGEGKCLSAARTRSSLEAGREWGNLPEGFKPHVPTDQPASPAHSDGTYPARRKLAESSQKGLCSVTSTPWSKMRNQLSMPQKELASSAVSRQP